MLERAGPAGWRKKCFKLPIRCFKLPIRDAMAVVDPELRVHGTLLLDSRVVDVPRAYNRTFVMLSSLKPFFFNSLQKELRFSDNAGA